MIRIDWKGDQVRAKVAMAAAIGLDATMADAVRKAKADHPAYPPPSEPDTRYANRTTFNTQSITFTDAEIGPARVSGRWGAYTDYSLYLEIGTSREDSGAPWAQERALVGPETGMWSIPYPSPSGNPQMAPRYTLRPAADDAYPFLVERIRAAYQLEAGS